MSAISETAYEAWIDVGGTFTDCFLRDPQGNLRRLKVLSSGRVPISMGRQLGPSAFEISELCDDCPEFWTGALVRFFDKNGSETSSRVVTGFRDSVLELDRPLPDTQNSQAATAASQSDAVRVELDPQLEAPVLAVRRLLNVPITAALPPLRVRLGTTKGTNALLTRRGARTAFAITSPFEDLLRIGDQTRPDLFALGIEKPLPLAELAIGVKERVDANGSILFAMDCADAREKLCELREAGFESLAICLMHGYLNAQHEQQLASLAAEVGFAQVSCSHQLAPLIEIVARAQTTVVDAYLSPIIGGYLQRLIAQFGGEEWVQMHVMTSAGGLVEWSHYSGKDCILSGPAGGVAALRGIARATRLPQMIGLDMGGTSTDVCRVAGEHNLQYESTKAGVRILTPTLPIETVASGGGSICWYDGVSLRVGPQSAGAFPGPACYGRGGPLSVTDLNVFLGRIPPEQFPFPLDLVAIEQRLDEVLQATAGDLGIATRGELAEGLRRIANEQMAEAVRTVSITQGADPRTHALLGFGGAAGQHICEIADALGMTQVIDSENAGLLSALGMGLANQRLDAAISVYQSLDAVDWTPLKAQVSQAASKLLDQLQTQGARASQLSSQCWLELRYTRTDATLTVPWSRLETDDAIIRQGFESVHRQRYGYARGGRGIELVAVRLEALATSAHILPPASSLKSESVAETPFVAGSDGDGVGPQTGLEAAAPSRMSRVRREEIRPGQMLHGPCIVLNPGSTLVIEPHWQAECLSDGTLRLTKSLSDDPSPPAPSSANGQMGAGFRMGSESGDRSASDNRPEQPIESGFDPIFRDCFAQRLSAIATQMGAVLQQTAVSVNVKQRRDFSCAVFDSQGQLLANAPHVPVHLGAMGRTVRGVIEQYDDVAPGDCFITNDPYRGGSHLPDVTVITPVFATSDEGSGEFPRLAFFVANRAHHADIGGIAPGSMSVAATRLGDEGVVIEPMRLTWRGEDRSDELLQRMLAAKYPPRNPDENLADIAAQQAANTRGVELLSEYAASTSWRQLEAYGGHLLDAAEERVRNFLAENFSGTAQFEDHMDDGTPIRVAISTTSPGSLTVDFSGSGPTSPLNFNANPSIVTAAVMYVLRCLIADDLPLNEGVMRCIRLIIPEGILNPRPHADPTQSPAVVAGNVETSQRVVDVLLGAMGAAAASQGTMNNLLFGNHQFGFYETICGGAGAIAGKAGASGVHTHMTNTRLTDPEVLERRYPVRLIQFGLRHGSGGGGQWPGGDGVIRTIEFLESVELSLLTSRRGRYAPFGLAGGQAGKIGSNVLITAGGIRRPLDACCQLTVACGDRLEIQTPGGGGYGST